MSTTSNFFKTSAILSTALLSLLGACAIDDPIDYTTSFEAPSTADQNANNERFLSFEGVFAQDGAEVNTERRIKFPIEEAVEANKEYIVKIDDNEFSTLLLRHLTTKSFQLNLPKPLMVMPYTLQQQRAI